jgi:hypothetical protein
MKCKKCGWMLEYIPRSFQEQIREIIREQERKVIMDVSQLNCSFKKRMIGEIIYGRNEKKKTVS